MRPTSVLFGADWGASDQVLEADKEAQQKMEEDFDAFTEAKSADLAKPLSDAKFPYKIHIVKDHDLKERICLEIERLGVNAGKDSFDCGFGPLDLWLVSGLWRLGSIFVVVAYTWYSICCRGFYSIIEAGSRIRYFAKLEAGDSVFCIVAPFLCADLHHPATVNIIRMTFFLFPL